jgi:G3E family GTPase
LDAVLGHDAFNLDRILAIEPDFLTEGHEHEHDDGVTSISLEGRQPLDPNRFFAWIREVTTRQGPDVLRLKGIIAMKDDDQRFVVQGVHMLIEGDRQRPWAEGETRDSRLVFIGRNLDRAALADGFAACAA